MLSAYAKREWGTILIIGLLLTFTLLVVGWWPLAIVAALAALALLLFYRDPERRPPTQRGVVVAAADGRISSVHRIEQFEPFDGEGATCIRIFLSVLDVHVNRAPCHGVVGAITHKPGQHLNALNPDSAEANESVTMILHHPIKEHPVAAVRQVAGLLARTIVNVAKEGQVIQRGQRFGVIKLGSTTEVYLPDRSNPQVAVHKGQKVVGGVTVIAHVQPTVEGAPRPDGTFAERVLAQQEPEAASAPAQEPQTVLEKASVAVRPDAHDQPGRREVKPQEATQAARGHDTQEEQAATAPETWEPAETPEPAQPQAEAAPAEVAATPPDAPEPPALPESAETPPTEAHEPEEEEDEDLGRSFAPPDVEPPEDDKVAR